MISRIPVTEIIRRVRKQYGVDAGAYFDGLREITVRECPATGYRFYHPFRVEADAAFYDRISGQGHYYPTRRWEFSRALEQIADTDRVLEIGSGEGDFLQLLRQRGVEATGLELSREAVKKMRQKQLQASASPVWEYAQENPEKYDAVCFFQVLEHVSDVHSFMKAAVACLKPEGRLLLAVPNNDSPVRKYDTILADNLPPHHMGLWTPYSLVKMGGYFGLEQAGVQIQELPADYRGHYYRLMVYKNLGKAPGRLIVPLTRWLAKLYLAGRLHKITGPTVFASYKKKIKV